jgi:hypothetical protein
MLDFVNDVDAEEWTIMQGRGSDLADAASADLLWYPMMDVRRRVARKTRRRHTVTVPVYPGYGFVPGRIDSTNQRLLEDRYGVKPLVTRMIGPGTTPSSAAVLVDDGELWHAKFVLSPSSKTQDPLTAAPAARTRPPAPRRKEQDTFTTLPVPDPGDTVTIAQGPLAGREVFVVRVDRLLGTFSADVPGHRLSVTVSLDHLGT